MIYPYKSLYYAVLKFLPGQQDWIQVGILKYAPMALVNLSLTLSQCISSDLGRQVKSYSIAAVHLICPKSCGKGDFEMPLFA